MKAQTKKFLKNLYFPFLFLTLLWIIEFAENVFHLNFTFLGIYPLSVKGLIGIITSPLIHSGYDHLAANSLPLFVLSACLFYFYRQIAYKIFFLLYFITNVWVWFLARDAYHIGASGLIYGLAAYLFTSGLVRKNTQLAAIALIVIFLYGSMIWGVFPDFFPEKNISWESHLMGLLAGIVLAIFFRNEGPRSKTYDWEDDDEYDNEFSYWKADDENPLI